MPVQSLLGCKRRLRWKAPPIGRPLECKHIFNDQPGHPVIFEESVKV